MWHFLVPNNGRSSAPDELFADQFAAFTAAGLTVSTCTDGEWDGAQSLRGIPQGSSVVYRGWMKTADDYAALFQAIKAVGGVPLTTPNEYLATHHLPNWYSLLAEFTPETRVFPVDANLVQELEFLGWETYFLKDYVKSLKTGLGSIIHEPAEAPLVLAELAETRGFIEGGICVRRVEPFVPDSEQRYFVLRAVPYADSAEPIPDIVRVAADRIASPFFSVDVVRRRDGALRIVEVGDGQVSDLVRWSPQSFAALWPRAH